MVSFGTTSNLFLDNGKKREYPILTSKEATTAYYKFAARFKITGYIHRYIRIYLLGRAGDKIFPI